MKQGYTASNPKASVYTKQLKNLETFVSITNNIVSQAMYNRLRMQKIGLSIPSVANAIPHKAPCSHRIGCVKNTCMSTGEFRRVPLPVKILFGQ